jgi:putative membrane protein
MYTWNFEPTLVIGLLLQPLAYLACIGPLRRWFPGAAPVSSMTAQIFLLGSLVLFVALVSPIDTLSAVSLTMHMVQHLLITLVAAPLLLAGTPPWLFRPLLRLPFATPVGRFLTAPVAAFIIYNATFSLWHVPRYYDLALQDQGVHIAEHISFLVAAVLGWWPIFSPMKELPRLAPMPQCVYLFFQSLPPTILGALITFAPTVIYAPYANAPQVLGLAPLQDQQLAGLIMWVPGGLIFFAVLTVVFIRYLNRDEYEPDADSQPAT